MTKQRKIVLRVLFLLGVYAISILPSFVLHHHDTEIVAYQVADHCEKAIYYGDSEEKCHHQSHLSKTIEKCNLCDHHTLAIDIIAFPFLHFFHTEYKSEFNPKFVDYYFQIYSNVSNRGPPSI
ncbi:MAG: hypothetical protein IPK03_10580 [Bacteroidetes bacterium]|nr:hypothetical protein [Bacteroidota bacterium]